MHFKLIIAIVADEITKPCMTAAREAGATGATVLSQARGEGADQPKSFLGLTLETQRDLLLFVVEEHLARDVLEAISEVGEFDDKHGTGIAFQLDVEDAIGLKHQIETLTERVEEEL